MQRRIKGKIATDAHGLTRMGKEGKKMVTKKIMKGSASGEEVGEIER